MNRRTFVTGTVAIAALPRMTLAQSTPEARGQRVEGEWISADESNGLVKFLVAISAYPDSKSAAEAHEALFEGVQEGTIYNEDTNTETFGDKSFFVEYHLPYFVNYEATVLLGNLVYEFRWECVHYGGAREGHKLFESVFERAVVQESYTVGELTALLPIDAELAEFGLLPED